MQSQHFSNLASWHLLHPILSHSGTHATGPQSGNPYPEPVNWMRPIGGIFARRGRLLDFGRLLTAVRDCGLHCASEKEETNERNRKVMVIMGDGNSQGFRYSEVTSISPASLMRFRPRASQLGLSCSKDWAFQLRL